jgi:hypothetical protein
MPSLRVGLALLLLVSGLFGASTDVQQTSPRQTYVLPKPHQWNTQQTLKCKAIGSVSLRQKGLVPEADQNILVGEAKPGTDKLEVTLVKDTLLVRVGEAGTDRYRVTGNTKLFLGAVFIGDLLPVVHTIVIDKEKSYVSWAINEPMDLFTNIPYSQSIFFACQ